jgi:hypothetical protein
VTKVVDARTGSPRKSTTAAYILVTLVVLCILALMPFALTSAMADITEQSAPVYVLNTSAPDQEVSANAHLQVITLNEWESTVSIRVAAHQSCDRECPWGDRYLFTSVYGDTHGEEDDRPATDVVTLAATARDVTQVIKLPIYGDPIRYPFDSYELAIGVVVDREFSDGTTRTLTEAEARQYLGISLQGRIPRATMSRPEAVDPATLTHPGNEEPYMVIYLVTFGRPLYLKVLTVLLVLLVSAAAAYAVFLRPLNELIIGSGALVLGVWGVRAVLLGGSLPGITAVDLALIVVMLFLLATITVRTAWLLEERSAVKPIFRRLFGAAAKAPAPDGQAPPPTVDFVPGRAAESTTDGISEGEPAATRRGS